MELGPRLRDMHWDNWPLILTILVRRTGIIQMYRKGTLSEKLENDFIQRKPGWGMTWATAVCGRSSSNLPTRASPAMLAHPIYSSCDTPNLLVFRDIMKCAFINGTYIRVRHSFMLCALHRHPFFWSGLHLRSVVCFSNEICHNNSYRYCL